MLQVTDDALRLVRILSDQVSLPEHGGLRIVLNPATNSLSMGLATAPEDADAIIDQGGARLFLSVPAAERMKDQTLCAEITSSRSMFFLCA